MNHSLQCVDPNYGELKKKEREWIFKTKAVKKLVQQPKPMFTANTKATLRCKLLKEKPQLLLVCLIIVMQKCSHQSKRSLFCFFGGRVQPLRPLTTFQKAPDWQFKQSSRVYWGSTHHTTSQRRHSGTQRMEGGHRETEGPKTPDVGKVFWLQCLSHQSWILSLFVWRLSLFTPQHHQSFIVWKNRCVVWNRSLWSAQR